MIRFELMIMMIIILILIAIINSNNNRVVSPLCECVCVRVLRVCVHLCLPRSVALSRVRTCTRLETQVSFGESRAREKRRDARGSAVRARLTEGESRYWEQSAGEVCSPRLPPLSPPPGCRVALALSLSTLLPPPPPPIAFPSLSSSPFSCLSDSLPLPTRSVSFAPIVRLFSLSLSLSLPSPLSLPLLLFPQRSLSAPVRRGAGAKRTKPKLKLGCRLLRRLFLRRCWLLAA